MKKFKNFPIRTKIFLSFGILICMIVCISLTAYVTVSSIQEKNKSIYEIDAKNVQNALTLRGVQSDARLTILSMLADPNNSTNQLRVQSLEDEKTRIITLITEMITLNQGNPDFLQKLEDFKKSRDDFALTRDNETIPLIQAGDLKTAKDIEFGIQYSRYLRITTILDDIVSYADTRALDSIRQSESLASLMNTVIIIIFILSLIVGFGLAFIITRSTLDPLDVLTKMANQIAAGDLNVEIPPDPREDEIGKLKDSFRKMLKGLREVHSELSESIFVLASSSNEILDASIQIAATATETAATVSETAATIEEVKQTSDISSETARLVSEKAQLASNVSQTGQKAVEEMVASFQRVQQQMESIAENVVQLAEKSQEIGEIIVTVNDIAEQSNILAINASIEAALAGEEGRRFDVVAQEIRNLADQSKQATSQVRTILTDIQRGVSTAVMATEQGNRTVGESVKQSNEAGESISTLTETISDSATAAIQNAVSSQQQNVGIGQIIQSMENIRQASMQNIIITKQAEDTAKNLHNLGQKLQQIANRYRL
ncbi:MAG: methyl-accepting chemotaxis protein [Methanobacteriota archaeon]